MKELFFRKLPLWLVAGASFCLVSTLTPAFGFAAGTGYYQQQQTPLKTVLDRISRYYKVNLLFEDKVISNKSTTYQFNPSGNDLQKALRDVLTPLGLKSVKVDDENYGIVPASQKSNNSTQPKAAEKDVLAPTQDHTTAPDLISIVSADPNQQNMPVGSIESGVVRGRIVSEEREEPVPGASINVKNSKLGTTTDADGYFTLRVPATARVLLIGHISYNATEVAVDTRNNMFIRMKPKSQVMNEVVVTTGLFKRSKENFTGASTTITGDQLRQVNSVSILDALKVFDPAVRIPDNIQFGSDPNRLPNITLRGTNNFPQTSTTTTSATPTSGADFMANYQNNPNQPLFILDGFEVSLQKIYDLDINRIATFTILKDAAATSIYGSRAANGVIVVDTKQPLAGKLRLSYSGITQISAPDLTVYDLANASEKLEVERLAGLYSTYANGIRPDADAVLRDNYAIRLAAVQRGVNTYWLSQPVRTGIGQRHSIYLEGGDGYVRYGLDFGYNNNSGVMKNSNRDTYSGGMNLSYRYKGLLFKNTLSITYNKGVNSNYGSFSDYTRQNQYWSPYDSNGNYVKVLEAVKNPLTPTSLTNYVNPLYNTLLHTIDEAQYTSIINQTNLEWLVGRGFKITGRLQINNQNDQSDYFLPAQHTSFDSQTDITKKGSYTKGNGKFFSYDGSLQLDYSKKFGKHQFLNSTGTRISSTKSDYLQVYVEGFPNDRLDQISFGNGYPPNTRPSYYNTITRAVSGFSNFNYTYDNRYVGDFSISTDGSSQFGSKKRFGTFWSVGGSWNMHKEKFIADKKYISLLRLRGSLGTTGDNKFQPFQGITTYQYYTDQNYRGQIGTILTGFGNENLQWQQTLKRNIGIDLGILQNRITLNVDVYRENTTNLILDVTTPPSVGFGSYRDNLGEIENKGVEFKLNAFLLRDEKKGTYWSVYINGLHNKDYIKKVSNSLSKLNQANDKNDQTRPQNRFEEGQSLNAIWAVRSLGIDPSNGREVYLKRDGTITYNWDPLDKVIVGNLIPDLRGSFGTSFTWKGFNVGLYFSYEFGGQAYNQTLIDRVEVTNYTYNVDRRVLLGRWAKPGDVTYLKGLVDENGRTVTTSTNATSRFSQNNNFVNAESISASYQLNDRMNKRLGLKNTRITFITNDIKRWSAIEVERGTQYPFARNFTINLSTTF